MNEFWLYILLGFFAGMIFCFLLMIGFVKKIIDIGLRKGGTNE